jgi:hypothetical protein
MNNFHYSNNIYELIEIILEEQFGGHVKNLGLALINNGPSSIQELTKLLSEEYIEVRNSLIILVQNRLVDYQEVIRKEYRETIYELNVENVLNYLRFPKILYFISHQFDQNALYILEEFMQFGILSADQVFEQVKEKLSQGEEISPIQMNNIKGKFLQLVESNYLIQCLQKKPSELKLENIKKSKDDTLLLSNKKKKKISREEEKKQIETKNTETMVNIIDEENPLIFNKEKQKYYYFCLNFEKIIIELKAEIVVDLVTQKMGGQAGLLASIMLKTNPGLAFREGKTFSLTIDEILKQMGFNSKDKKLYQEKQEGMRNVLEEMSREENDFVKLCTGSDSGQAYSLNLDSISKILKTKTLEKIIEQEFSADHIRIYRLLSKCGPLDAKNIMDVCLMVPKDCSSCLNQMIEHGFVETQPLNYKGSNIIFYNINSKTNIDLMVAKIYKVLLLNF